MTFPVEIRGIYATALMILGIDAGWRIAHVSDRAQSEAEHVMQQLKGVPLSS